MDKEKVLSYVSQLNATGKEERRAITAEFREEFRLKAANALKVLKEAGYDPEAETPVAEARENTALPEGCPAARDIQAGAGNGGAEPGAGESGTAPPPPDNTGDGVTPPPPAAAAVRVKLCHKTDYPKYRRAPLVIDRCGAEFEVTAEQPAVLKKDRRVVIDGKTYEERNRK